MLAADFCAVTLQRLHCLFVIEVGSRYVHIRVLPSRHLRAHTANERMCTN
jgi:hypothetical protein